MSKSDKRDPTWCIILCFWLLLFIFIFYFLFNVILGSLVSSTWLRLCLVSTSGLYYQCCPKYEHISAVGFVRKCHHHDGNCQSVTRIYVFPMLAKINWVQIVYSYVVPASFSSVGHPVWNLSQTRRVIHPLSAKKDFELIYSSNGKFFPFP